MKVKRRQTGFTLIEITIVVAVVALLAALIMPSIISARSKSQLCLCQTNLRQIDGAMQQYSLDYSNTAPPSLDILIGTDALIQKLPVCGGGGTYLLPVNCASNPRCSVHGSLWG